jgi:hypothetical protein
VNTEILEEADSRFPALLTHESGVKRRRTLAQGLGWPCVELRPSNFLNRGLENIYLVADEIFEDLMDLAGAVIFFDEMDALVRSRQEQLDATQQFLTTSMLPKLAELHDQGRVVFFVATNYRKTFDEAITRAGRFDLLLFVGPPDWREKLKGLHKMVTSTPLGIELTKGKPKKQSKLAIDKLRVNLRQWTRSRAMASKLGLFTYGEVKSLLEQLLRDTGERSSLVAAVGKLKKADFTSTVDAWASEQIVLRQNVAPDKPNKTYEMFIVDKTASRRQ